MTGPEYAGLREGDAVVAGGEGEDSVPGRGEARHDAVHLHHTELGVCNRASIEVSRRLHIHIHILSSL